MPPPTGGYGFWRASRPTKKEDAVAATTRAETYTYEQNFPTEEAARRARDDVDLHRAIIAYRFWFPTITLESIFVGLSECGVRDNQSVAIGGEMHSNADA